MPRWTKEKKIGTITSHGYKLITVNGKRMYEHRHVVENHIGRKLEKREQVHHKNGDKLDNRVDNLEVLDIAEHTALETTGREYVKRIDLTCERCGKKYFKIRRRKTRRFCSLECRNDWVKNLWKLSPQCQ